MSKQNQKNSVTDAPKYFVDLLNEDKPIAGQKFACVHSFHLKKF